MSIITSDQIATVRQPSTEFKPFRYQWSYDIWLKQQQLHWIPAEVQMGEDIKEWRSATRLTHEEREFLMHIFRFFTQADLDVNGGYTDHFLPYFKDHGIRMMLSSFCNMETIHIDAYSNLLETLGIPDSEFTKFREHEEMVAKHEYLSNFNMTTEAEALKSLAVFGAFVEGLQLFASFAMLLNFPRFGKMKGMGQIIAWSVRDESLHCFGNIKLFHQFAQETGLYTKGLRSEITDIAHEVVKLEDAFIDLAFADSYLKGITAKEMKLYIRFIADWRLRQLDLQPIYNIEKYPLPWLRSMLNGVEQANFFEVRPTEYNKTSTISTWHNSWDRFDARRDARRGSQPTE